MVKAGDMTPSSAALAGPVTPFPMKRKIAAILAADVVGYSRLVAEDEERTLRDLAAARQVFDALIARVGGRIFNTAGDSVMVEFDSAVEALRAAVDIQDALKSRNVNVEARRRLEFRMGLTIGDVVERDGDLLGDGVNIAARLEGLATPGGICVSRSVQEAVSNKLAITFRELGPRQVKNIPHPVFAYAIEPGKADVGLKVEPLVARRPSFEGERQRRRDPERRRERSFLGGLVRGLAITGAMLALIFLAVPMLRVARTSIENWQQPGPAAPDKPSEAKPQAGEKPPANESGTPSPSGPDKPPTQAEKPQAGPTVVPGPTASPARPVRPERTRPAARPEPPRPEAPKPEPAKEAAPRPERPADPAAAYASMAREGLIPDARSLAEIYHNARFHETKNDRGAALAAYAQAAPLAGEYLDVHFRYASLLRSQRGAGAVRQTYAALAKSSPSLAAEIVLALSYEGEDRRSKLQALVSANPNAAAIDTLMADALLDSRDGGPTLTDRRLAFDATERFLDSASGGEIAGRFVDRAFLDGWLDAARRRRGDIEKFFASGKTRPSASFSRASSGWLAKLTLPEPASAISVRIGERGEFTSTGFSSAEDPKTGKPLPNLDFQLASNTPRVTLYLTYQDRSGREAGPFPLSFDPGSATVDAGRSALERFSDSWVSFRDDMPDVLSFASLVSNRCALSKASIGFGDEPPRRAIPLPACDASGSAAMPSGSSLISLPDGTDAVQVQLVYADGTESEVRTFKRPQ